MWTSSKIPLLPPLAQSNQLSTKNHPLDKDESINWKSVRANPSQAQIPDLYPAAQLHITRPLEDQIFINSSWSSENVLPQPLKHPTNDQETSDLWRKYPLYCWWLFAVCFWKFGAHKVYRMCSQVELRTSFLAQNPLAANRSSTHPPPIQEAIDTDKKPSAM